MNNCCHLSEKRREPSNRLSQTPMNGRSTVTSFQYVAFSLLLQSEYHGVIMITYVIETDLLPNGSVAGYLPFWLGTADSSSTVSEH